MNYTSEQLEAINTKTTNIIVSAGAGSGKTAVLTKRIENLVLSGVDVEQLLVLTFTNKAAAEMKSRIKNAIKSHKELSNQVRKIDTAYITTFDSFTSSILRKYHYVLNVSRNFTIAPDGVIEIETYKIIDQIFNEYYEQDNNDIFKKFIYKYVLKNDKTIKQDIIKIYLKLKALPNFYDYINNYEKTYYFDNIDNNISYYIDYIFQKKALINEHLEVLKDDINYYKDINLLIEPLLESDDYVTLKSNLDVKLKMAPRGSSEEIKTAKASIADIISQLKSICIYEDETELKTFMENTKEDVVLILEIIKNIDIKLNEYKSKYDYFTFDDITMKVIELLEKNQYIADELKETFKEILIDEYQDTNDIGEKLISLISNNNVYVVGDVKQSIYKFRNANPALFQNKYDLYKSTNHGVKIDLNNNFRSRSEVVESINNIFEVLMDNDIGGASYRLDHQMSAGNKSYINEDDDYKFEVLNFDNNILPKFSKAEKEIFIVANDIKNKVINKYKVSSKEGLRPVEYSDFAIISEKTTSFDSYKKVFEYLAIPLTIIKDTNIAKENLMMIIKNYFNLLIKVKKKQHDESFKHSFISLERSFIINQLDEDIYTIFANNSFVNTKLYSSIEEILSNKNLTINLATCLFIEKFKIYEKLVYNGDIDSNDMILEFLYNTSSNFDDSNFTIEEFYNYLCDINDNDIKINSTSSITNNSSVTMMTIHRSKGLEFPICYITGCLSKFNIKELTQKFIYSAKHGIITPFYNGMFIDNVLKKIIYDDEVREIISEKIRLFYVAITRAKEKNIIITSFENDDEDPLTSGIVSFDKRMQYRSFNDIVKSIYPVISDCIKTVDLETVGLTDEYKNTNFLLEKYEKDANFETIEFKENVIDSNLINKRIASSKVDTILTNKEKINIETGINFHRQLEYFDFTSLNSENKLINNLLKMPFMENIESKKVIPEFEYIDGNNKGVIDLIIISDKTIDIIDYKLSNIDNEKYDLQVKTYMDYIQKNYSEYKINGYLYSITTSNYRQIT